MPATSHLRFVVRVNIVICILCFWIFRLKRYYLLLLFTVLLSYLSRITTQFGTGLVTGNICWIQLKTRTSPFSFFFSFQIRHSYIFW